MRNLISLIAVVLAVLGVACTGSDQSGRSSDISEPSNPTDMQRPPFSPSPSQLAQMRSSPEFKAAEQKLRERVAARQNLPFAFVEQDLPNGVASIVRLNQPGPQSRYVVVSERNFETSTLLHALSAEAWYTSKYSDDASPVAITVFNNGEMIADSKDRGEISHRVYRNGPAQERSGIAARLLRQVNKSKAKLDVPGYGAAILLENKQ